MKLSRNFVSDYISVPVDIKTLAENMTNAGNEYDYCGKLLPATNLVIGEVVECVDHPDSDHLHLCKVNIGNEILQIVCGAPNARKGIKVIVALDGAVLPGGTIKKGMIRGQESNGMLCSISELGLDHKFLKEEDIEGICELPENAPVGEDPLDFLEMNDEVIDFDLTSNRGDLLSILGMAYEIGAIYGEKVKEIDLSFKENDKDINDIFNLSVETENCPLFLVKKVENVVIKDSPKFIKNRLIASGIRPINNVVDISNYVMVETGQPLHFYDADRLGNNLLVRMANDKETLVTLDNQTRTLSNTDIVIATKTEAIGLAGVMGGLTTEIENDTKNIIIESAIFNATAVRKTSKKVLRSEASNRFEKGLDPKRTYMAMMRSCHLLEKYADATITFGMVEHKKLELDDKVISISVEKINRVLGIQISLEEIINIFDKLGFSSSVDENKLLVTVPSRRTDISISEDLIEEVGRIYGIDRINGKEMILPVKPGKIDKFNRFIRTKLADLGLNETLSYALISEKEVYNFTNKDFEIVKIQDPMTEERNTLRYSLLQSLMNIYQYNKARNQKDISIFEIGKGFCKRNEEYQEVSKLAVLMSGTYSLGLKKEKVDFYVLKGILEELLESLGYKNRYSLRVDDSIISELHPGQSANIILNNVVIGVIGKIHPAVSMKEDIYVMEIDLDKLKSFRVKSMQYKEFSRYPSIEKDFAFILEHSIRAEEVIRVIQKTGGKLLEKVEIFDVYEGEKIAFNKKSIAFNLTFMDPTRTLSDEEVMNIFNKIIQEVESKFSAELRDK